jgi:hypothetical protein
VFFLQTLEPNVPSQGQRVLARDTVREHSEIKPSKRHTTALQRKAKTDDLAGSSSACDKPVRRKF